MPIYFSSFSEAIEKSEKENVNALAIQLENGKIITDFRERASTDNSLKGIRTMYKENPEKALKIADEIIKNTYRTLMTRGMKGCYVYCVDEGLRGYLNNKQKGKQLWNF